LAASDQAHRLVRAQAWTEIAQKLDQEGDYDAAMDSILKCKDILKAEESQVLQESEVLQRHLQSLAESLTRDHFQRWLAASHPLPPRRLAVLAGFPRSGTTLLEQVLDSHPGLVSSDEREAFGRDIFPAMWRSPSTPLPTPEALDAIPTERLAAQRDRYLA